MENRLARDAHALRSAQILSGVRIPVELREVARRDIDTEPVTRKENICRSDQVDLELVYLVRPQQFNVVHASAEARAEDTLRDVHRIAVGKDIDELRHPIRV